MDNVGEGPVANIADTVALGVSFYSDKAGQSKGLFHRLVWLIPYRYPRTSSTLETIKIPSG